MSKIAFAIENIKTSQGFVDAAHPVPAQDIPSEELAVLLEEKKICTADHDSALALRAHEIRKAGDKASAATLMRAAAEQLSDRGADDVVAEETDPENGEPKTDDQKPNDGDPNAPH